MHGTIERRLFDAGPVQWAGALIAVQFLGFAIDALGTTPAHAFASLLVLAAWLAYPVWLIRYFKPEASSLEAIVGVGLVALATVSQLLIGWDWKAWSQQLLAAVLFTVVFGVWFRASRAVRATELAAGIDIPAGRVSAMLWMMMPFPIGPYVLHRRMRAAAAAASASGPRAEIAIVRPWVGAALALTFVLTAIYLVVAFRH